ncbi:hypothetical protein K491DRAFT_608263 [Lophiostoma macrostomum CBS 122681]|uniref:Uncharacterized protein n=1 Tax=Lophiostoma macrostomum CBS 122681 TaxID=1314788 RepID=A0A6A6SST9_9PLEO|nr:hypothetical protein K491DRAFT_608263 [Lophiostoma macrostomum CBS 122681]
MSVFLATVPQGTQLYHGTYISEPVKGTEWLAFEPEHALIFARPQEHGPPPEFHGPPHSGPRPGSPRPPPPSQHPLIASDSDAPSPTGYLHTYAATHPLSLLYIDGMSAGKTTNGTLDSQDHLLLNLSLGDRNPMGGEFARAEGLCNLSYSLWNSKIDGFLRMEMGFEIILCDFEKSLDRKAILAVDTRRDDEDRHKHISTMGGWRYYQAVADRYHGIGGGRIAVDYENFVTAFEHTGSELWDNDSESDVPMPRLTGVADADLIQMRDAVTSMVLSAGTKRQRLATDARAVNWQALVDMLVTRYSTPLHALSSPTSPLRSSKDAFADYLSALLRPFIDLTARNTTLETSRCIAQIVPPLPTPPASLPCLAHRTVHAVAYSVCHTLITAFDITTLSLPRSVSSTSPSQPPSQALDLIDALVAYLQWTTWKQCGACRDDELCIVPIWPMGTHEEHANPSCKNESMAANRGGYWGYRRRGPPPEEPGKEPLCGRRGRGTGMVHGHGCPRPGPQLRKQGGHFGRVALAWVAAWLRELGVGW